MTLTGPTTPSQSNLFSGLSIPAFFYTKVGLKFIIIMSRTFTNILSIKYFILREDISALCAYVILLLNMISNIITNIYIWPIDYSQTGTTTPDSSGPGSNSYKGVFYTTQISRTGASFTIEDVDMILTFCLLCYLFQAFLMMKAVKKDAGILPGSLHVFPIITFIRKAMCNRSLESYSGHFFLFYLLCGGSYPSAMDTISVF